MATESAGQQALVREILHALRQRGVVVVHAERRMPTPPASDLQYVVAEIDNIKAGIEELAEVFADYIIQLRQADTDIRTELQEELLRSQLGADTARLRMRQYVPVRVFLGDAQGKALTSEALHGLLSTIRLETSVSYPDEEGSWFKKWIARTKDPQTRADLEKDIRKLQRAVENALVERNQGRINRDHALAASALLKALQGQEPAICQIGSLLILKCRGPEGKPVTIVKTLTVDEMLLLEGHPEILKEPARVLERLRNGNGSVPEREADHDALALNASQPTKVLAQKRRTRRPPA